MPGVLLHSFLKRYYGFQNKYGIYGVFELPEGVVLRHHDRTWMEFLTSGFEEVRFDEFDAVTMNSNCARAFQWLGCKPKK